MPNSLPNGTHHSIPNGVTDDCSATIEPIAIIGMALRLPGGINSPSDLWNFLVEKRDAHGPMPTNRYNGDAFYDEAGKPGSANVNAGYFLDRDLELFDLATFPMLSKAEIEVLDPVQRQLLEIVRECLDAAGETGWRGRDVGCFVGTFGEDWQDLRREDTQDFGAHRLTGSMDFAAANRISYVYDLRGPSVTIRTACSASLVALHSACQALHQGDCSAAIVAGANLILSPTNTSGLAEVGALSPDASCKTFDAKANGYARAEGVNALYLKKLSDAVACGDHIRAVIRSTASNSDGRSSSFSNPNPDAHAALMRSAYRRVGLHPAQTGFVEMHGTGTAAGDPIEARAVGEVFGDGGTYIGSIKPNVGHSEGASGITSVIKAVLALENRTIPPNIKFEMANPKIPFREANLIVPVNPLPWPTGRKERVSVNSFGLGGSNAHAILESARSIGTPESITRDTENEDIPRLLVLSADHPESLQAMFDSHAAYLQNKSERSADLLFTLNNRREHLQYRAFSILQGAPMLPPSKPIKPSAKPRTVFVFTGQGAQYTGMARSLALHSYVFRNVLEELDQSLAALVQPPAWSIKDTILHPPKDLDLGGVVSQPLCTAIQIALVNQLRVWGVEPDIIVGHSSGEIAAAYAASAVSMNDAIRLSYFRGQSLPSSSKAGGMAAVGLGKAEVQKFLISGVTVGCDNSPENVTLSGDREALEKVVRDLRERKPEVFVRMLDVDMAYHSCHMKEVSAEYEKALDGLQLSCTRVPYFSSTYGRWLTTDDPMDAAYWKANLESPVLFRTAIQGILKDAREQVIFVEIGPHPALRAPIRQCFGLPPPQPQPIQIPTLVREKDALQSLLTTAGSLHSAGVKLDLSALTAEGNLLSDLPPYPFHYERIWRESRISRSWRFRKHSRHDLLGVSTLENNELEPAWRNILRPTDVPWLCDHQIGPNIVFPAAAYIDMAGEALYQITGTRGYCVRNVSILAAMVLHEGQTTEILTSLKPCRWTDTQLSRRYEFTISSLSNDIWTVHCRGQVQAVEGGVGISVKPVLFPRKVRSRRWYYTLQRVGLNYGSAFARLDNITASVSDASASAVAMLDSSLSARSHSLHPTLIDQAFQLMCVADARGHPRAVCWTYVPTYIKELSIQPSTLPLNLRADVATSERITGSVSGCSDDNTVLSGRGIEMSQIQELQEDPVAEKQSGARVEWLPLLRFMDPGTLLSANGDACGNAVFEFGEFLCHFTHENPICNILEIQTGAPSQTEDIIKKLYSLEGERMFASYTLASPSAEALSSPTSATLQHAAIDYISIDLTQDIVSQGVELASFDLVIVQNSTDGTTQDHEVLHNIRRLIKPNGYLLLGRSFADHVSLSCPTTESSILAEAEHSMPETTMCSAKGKWETLLQHAGFSVVAAQSRPYRASMIAQPVVQETRCLERVTLLVPSKRCNAVQEVISMFAESGISTKICQLSEAPPADPFIISLLDFDEAFLAHASDQKFPQLTRFVSALGLHQHFLWLTLSSDPEYALVHGLARNIRFELGLDFATLDLDSIAQSNLVLLPAFMKKYRFDVGDGETLDNECAIVDGMIKVARFHWYSIDSALQMPPSSKSGARLTVGKKGLLQRLAWTATEECEPGANMIQVEISAVGMNFKDVLVAMGVVSGDTLGIEAAGIVSQVGSRVTDIAVGDRVAIAYNGCFATRITVPRLSCIRLPDAIDLNSASTLYGVYCTSLMSLMHIARISAASSVLIHSACGGVGISAIQLCQSVGAEIYATVGSEKKRRYLQDTFNIPADHIFSSRHSSFASDLMACTHNRGVDVVLNSLSGELLHASWDCVADFGMMVELGRRDIQEHGKLDMSNFSRNRGYHAVDYAQILREKPELNQRLMQEVTDLLQQGKIAPIAPLTAFDAVDVEHAFRFLQKGDHIGKVVVHMPSLSASPSIVPSLRRETSFAPDVGYLLVGGLGGLGRAIAIWMCELGARHLIFLTQSRSSALSSKKLVFLQELAAMGCTYEIFHRSVAHLADVEYVVQHTTKPIRGVMQMAAHLKDRNIASMSYEDWRAAVDPKVMGTINLHRALANTDLDFFVLFSSHVGLHGWYGQSNYAASNAFLDAFVQHRHSQGLVASVLDIGAVEDIGMTSENPDLARRMRSTFRHFLSETQLFKALELAIHRSRPASSSSGQVIAGLRPHFTGADANSNLPWTRDSRFLVGRNIEEDMTTMNATSSQHSSPSSSALSKLLVSCTRDPSILTLEDASPAPSTILSHEILARICSFLAMGENEQQRLKQMDVGELALEDLGVDSLVAIELRNWWKLRLGIDVSVIEILDCGTVKKLRELALAGLKARFRV